ncbi:hypothetical protein BWI96_20880 [Siphonobacter sp. SORGH_AS_0500]|uniref:Ig-like domain-containing protein n=1 Tax=Siphonobacter sp. SORGH_AS_0500 TaxID=1864824 RepID=UPI000CA9250D|nr:Ig-like domain-containing protein [Siphonobacter sp. SORGH_AS_0500]PKK34684.1 hypothetical protein BWI96_20880 [Siphonobacter sp. SORGH_AS_0500]
MLIAKFYPILFLALTVLACNKEQKEPATLIDSQELSLHYDETHQFTLKKGASDVAATDYTWKSSNTDVAEISTSGKLDAGIVGDSKVTAVSKNGSETVESIVKVIPYYNTCKEPIIEFGITQAALKSKETRTQYGTGTSTGIVYTGENSKLKNVIYLFENNALTSSTLVFGSNSAIAKEVATFFLERYKPIGTANGVYFFRVSSTVTVGVGVSSSLGMVALYMPQKSGGRQSANYDSFQEGLKALEANGH